MDGMDISGGPVGVSRDSAFVSDTDVVEERGTRWDPRMSDNWSVVEFPSLKGFAAPISVWAAVQCNQFLGQELSPEDAEHHMAKVRAAEGRELGAWSTFNLFFACQGCDSSWGDGTFSLVSHAENCGW